MKKLTYLLALIAMTIIMSCEKIDFNPPICKTCMTWVTVYDTIIIETGGLYGSRDGTEILIPTAFTRPSPYVKVCDEELKAIDGITTRDTVGRQIIVTQTRCD